MQSYLIEKRIREVEKDWRQTRVRTWVWTGLLVLVGVALLVGIVDWTYPLPSKVRLWIWIVGVQMALFGPLYLIMVQRRRRLGSQRAALLIEKRHPELQDHLVSAVQFGAQVEWQNGAGVSHFLVKKLIAETEERIKGLDLRGVVERSGLHRRMGAALGSLTAVWLLVAFGPAVCEVQAERVLVPWSQVESAGGTSFAVSPGDIELRAGNDQTIEAQTSGVDKGEVLLHFRAGEGEWKRLEMAVAEENCFVHELFDVREDFDYRIAVGEESSPTYRLSVYAPPELVEITANCTFPDYTGLADGVQTGGDVRAVVGTQVALSARFSKPLATARLCMERGDSLEAVELSGETARFAFEVVDTTVYRLEVVDLEGYANDGGETSTIYGLADGPPVVRFPEPGGDVWGTQADVVPVSVTAEDDFGLRNWRFAYTISGEEERELGAANFSSPGMRTTSGGHEFALRKMGLEPGQVITYYAEAADFSPTGRPVRSDIYMIAVRPFQERLAGIGGQCQGACELLSARQAGLLRSTWRLARTEMPWDDQVQAAADLAAEQNLIWGDLQRLLTAAGKAIGGEGEVDLDAVLEAGQVASAAMGQAVSRLEAVEAEEAVPPEQEALSALLRLEMELPKTLGSGGGGDGGGGGMTTAGEEALEEVAKRFEEQEVERKGALFRRGLDLLARAKRAHGGQQSLNGTWSVRGRREGMGETATEQIARQEGLRQETAVLEEDVALLERELGEELAASVALGRAAGRMGEVVEAARGGRFQRASAQGTKARVQLERAIDILYPLMARHGAQLLPLLAAALEELAARQELLAGDAGRLEEREIDQETGLQLAELMLAQHVLPESAARIRQRLEAAIEELEPLSVSLAEAALTAGQAMRDSLVEEGMKKAAGLMEGQKLTAAAVEQYRVARALREIAAELARAAAGGDDSELAQVSKALAATRSLRRSVNQGDGAGGGPLKELKALYSPIEEEALNEGLAELQGQLAGSGKGNGLPAEMKEGALATLDGLVEALERRLEQLEQLQRLQQYQRDGYPPAFRELVHQYYRRLAKEGDVQ
jgi:hypothetical protein